MRPSQEWIALKQSQLLLETGDEWQYQTSIQTGSYTWEIEHVFVRVRNTITGGKK
jgi:hypothetical protein